jgi:hypothetical protein
MDSDAKKPVHQPETESGAELQEFTLEALSPDDPRLRRSRTADRKCDPRFDPPIDDKSQ